MTENKEPVEDRQATENKKREADPATININEEEQKPKNPQAKARR